jgi:hypothetical protein
MKFIGYKQSIDFKEGPKQANAFFEKRQNINSSHPRSKSEEFQKTD